MISGCIEEGRVDADEGESGRVCAAAEPVTLEPAKECLHLRRGHLTYAMLAPQGRRHLDPGQHRHHEDAKRSYEFVPVLDG
jgi:hypothetical protein